MRLLILLCLLLTACSSPHSRYLPGSAALQANGSETKRQLSSLCPNANEALLTARFPREAYVAGVESGRVVVQFLLQVDGHKSDIMVLESTHPAFSEAALAATNKILCLPTEGLVRVQVPFAFNLSD